MIPDAVGFSKSMSTFSHETQSKLNLLHRSDEYGEGPKGPASTGEEAEMGFEAG